MKIYAANTTNPLDKFVGKDLWVKVEAIAFRLGDRTISQFRYAKLNRKLNPLKPTAPDYDPSYREYFGYAVYASFIDGESQFTTYEELYAAGGAEEVLKLPLEWDVNDIFPVYPITVLTTEEMIDRIDELLGAGT